MGVVFLGRRGFTSVGVVFTSVGVVLPLWAWFFLCTRGVSFVGVGLPS